MVTITSPPLQLQESNRVSNHVILKGVSWSTYKALMAEVGDDRAWRIAYNQRVLEIRMPLEEHEEPKRLIESFIEAIVDELEIELRSLGSLTLEREELSRGVEPDIAILNRLWRNFIIIKFGKIKYLTMRKKMKKPFYDFKRMA
jgi:Uma2 family endonuclease